MLLAKYVEEQEEYWHLQSQEHIHSVIKLLQNTLELDLSTTLDTDNSTDIFNFCVFFFIDKYKPILYKVLNLTHFNIDIIEKNIIICLIINITRKTTDIEYLKSLLIKGEIISDLITEGNKYIIKTKSYGTITFYSIDDLLENNPNIKEFYNNNPDIQSSCHESTLYLLPRNKKYKAVTSICMNMAHEKYFHSFILDDTNVIDLTENVIMPKENYYLLHNTLCLNTVTYDEYLEQSALSIPYDESKRLMELLRNTVHKVLTKDKIKKIK